MRCACRIRRLAALRAGGGPHHGVHRLGRDLRASLRPSGLHRGAPSAPILEPQHRHLDPTACAVRPLRSDGPQRSAASPRGRDAKGLHGRNGVGSRGRDLKRSGERRINQAGPIHGQRLPDARVEHRRMEGIALDGGRVRHVLARPLQRGAERCQVRAPDRASWAARRLRQVAGDLRGRHRARQVAALALRPQMKVKKLARTGGTNRHLTTPQAQRRRQHHAVNPSAVGSFGPAAIHGPERERRGEHGPRNHQLRARFPGDVCQTPRRLQRDTERRSLRHHRGPQDTDRRVPRHAGHAGERRLKDRRRATATASENPEPGASLRREPRRALGYAARIVRAVDDGVRVGALEGEGAHARQRGVPPPARSRGPREGSQGPREGRSGSLPGRHQRSRKPRGRPKVVGGRIRRRAGRRPGCSG
eukprot:1195890-Prorocentrum_minimum.AAC.7